MKYESKYSIGQKVFFSYGDDNEYTFSVYTVTNIRFCEHGLILVTVEDTKGKRYEKTEADMGQTFAISPDKLMEKMLVIWSKLTGVILSEESFNQIKHAIEWELTSL